MAHEQPRRDVDIFWDLGSCPVPTNTSGFTVVSQIRTLALRLGIVKSFKAYLSISDQDSNDQALTPRSELQSSGMSLTDVKQEIADMLIVDMLVHAFDRNSQNDSSIIMLIAGDPRFSYLLSILRKRNYRVVVLGPGGGQDDYLNKSASLASQANSWLDWNTEIMDSIRAEIPRSATAGANSASQTTENLDLTPDTGSERTSETKEKRAGAIDKDTSDRMQPGRDHNTEVNSSVEVVIEHFDERPDVGIVQRQKSPIIGLKSLNNWVKSVLIIRFAYPALQKSSVSSDERGRRGGGRGKVLDMGCGKGGDLVKWSKARIKELLCVEFAAVSVEQARSRYQSMDPSSFEASFASLDYYTEPLAKAFSPEKLSTPFDVVSMQFRMQYAFETLEKTRTMLGNVSRYLRPGGVFVGTIPDADLLMQELDALPPDTDDLSFGNNVYQIRFEQREPRPVFGHKYWLSLQDAVEDVPEYVVHWDNFVECV
ncbi:hypothetical protein EST38_g9977 [Candolleomyces aberdarensis]|uniref:mRNA cap guanine-N(7) methyltransferase n=1 Tax=Candolleomyces aberdarensis TaxID=2316362 RepID=A0A4Q2DBV1_9AGAR|nr:hypothetical protein EST38_g9977 [Candolleomyces aberdarensis]